MSIKERLKQQKKYAHFVEKDKKAFIVRWKQTVNNKFFYFFLGYFFQFCFQKIGKRKKRDENANTNEDEDEKQKASGSKSSK